MCNNLCVIRCLEMILFHFLIKRVKRGAKGYFPSGSVIQKGPEKRKKMSFELNSCTYVTFQRFGVSRWTCYKKVMPVIKPHTLSRTTHWLMVDKNKAIARKISPLESAHSSLSKVFELLTVTRYWMCVWAAVHGHTADRLMVLEMMSSVYQAPLWHPKEEMS